MSDRKPPKTTSKFTNPSNSKATYDSSHKRTVPRSRPQQIQVKAKNLMAEFERVQEEGSNRKDVQMKMQELSSVYDSSRSNELIERSGADLNVREEDYGFQLPRSYILAMNGLQEAVKQRDLEIKNVTTAFEQEKQINLNLKATLAQSQINKRESEKTITDLVLDINTMKEIVAETKCNLENSQRIRMMFEQEITILKESKVAQTSTLQLQLIQSKSQLSKMQVETINVKMENKKLQDQYELVKKELKEVMLRERDSRFKAAAVMKDLQNEIKKEQEDRLKAEKEIEILRKQIQLLAEKSVQAEGNQVVSRPPLTEMRVPNVDRRESLSKRIENPNMNVNQQIEKKTEINHSSSNATLNMKKQESSLLSRQRSNSRVKALSNCPQLVSQYRELMRHEKELVGLNYQLELLQKGLVGQGDGKGQIQRGYQKLRRECEQKQMQIRELKSFLSDPLK